jgi:hypothetical protein
MREADLPILYIEKALPGHVLSHLTGVAIALSVQNAGSEKL